MCESEFEHQYLICTLIDSIRSFIHCWISYSQINYSDDYGDNSHDKSEHISEDFGNDDDDTERHGWVISVVTLYSEGPRFKFRLGNRLSWQIFRGFLEFLHNNAGVLPETADHSGREV